MPVTIRCLAPPAFGDRGCSNSPNFCFHNLGWHCGDQFLLFLHQNAPDGMLKVKNFPGVISPDPLPLGGGGGGTRSADAWIRQFAMADLCDGGPEPNFVRLDITSIKREVCVYRHNHGKRSGLRTEINEK